MTASVHPHPHADEHAHQHHDSRVHGHEHAPFDPERSQLGPSDNGSVVLDIGEGFGALVLMAPESMLLDEIEISAVDDDSVRTHVAIRERRGPGGRRWAAIYPRLAAGEYTLWSRSGEPADRVTITSGQVAQLDWR